MDWKCKNAFSLLEMTIVVIIMTVLLTFASPSLYRAYLEKAGAKTALEMRNIQDAAQAYYVQEGAWPASINVLQSAGLLPPATNWKGVSPFNNTYNILFTDGPRFLTVSTQVVDGAQNIVASRLALAQVSGTTVSSDIEMASNAFPTGVILPWASNNLPAGFLWCDGRLLNISDYPILYAVIGTVYGGDAVNTFALPDMRARAVFGNSSGDSNFGSLGRKGGSASLVVSSMTHISRRGGSVPYGVDSEPVDDNSGGTDFSEHNLANVPVTGATDSNSSLPPYLTLNYIIKT